MMACREEKMPGESKGDSVFEKIGRSLGEPGTMIDTLVDVGTHSLHFQIKCGTGLPILFESGGGNDATVWNELLPALYDSLGATLITYDRAGFGKSGIDTTRINILNEVKDVEIALQKLGFGKNIFQVSHSLGGAYATLYASRQPQTIKGSVCIDITLPCFYTEEKTNEAIADMASYGIEKIKAELIGFYYIFANYQQTNELMRKTAYPPNIPTTVIVADRPPNIAKTAQDIEHWKSCMQAFGSLPGHSYVLAKNTSHQVFKDNPDLVNTEIIKLYRRVNK